MGGQNTTVKNRKEKKNKCLLETQGVMKRIKLRKKLKCCQW